MLEVDCKGSKTMNLEDQASKQAQEMERVGGEGKKRENERRWIRGGG